MIPRLWPVSSPAPRACSCVSLGFFLFVLSERPCSPTHPPTQRPADICVLLSLALLPVVVLVRLVQEGGEGAWGQNEMWFVCCCFPVLRVALCDSVLQVFGAGEGHALEWVPGGLKGCHLCAGVIKHFRCRPVGTCCVWFPRPSAALACAALRRVRVRGLASHPWFSPTVWWPVVPQVTAGVRP